MHDETGLARCASGMVTESHRIISGGGPPDSRGRGASPSFRSPGIRLKKQGHHPIDALARRLAGGPSRRELLRGVLAAAVALIATGPGEALGQECAEGCGEGEGCLGGFCQRTCQTHRDCRSKKKDDPCISNTCVEGFCLQAIVDCLPGYECCRGACCAKACAQDEECAIIDPCRMGRCGVEGVCEFVELDPCLVCESDLECATGGPNTVCCGGACRRPCPEGMVFGKGCECWANGSAEMNGNGIVVRDDASG